MYLALSISWLVWQAQVSVTVPPTPTCPACDIELTKVASLRIEDPSGDLDLDGRSRVTQDTFGRFYVWNRGRTSILVFDSAGRFLRQLGRKGQGPGEFVGAGGDIRSGVKDSLFVFSFRQLSVWAPTGKLAATVSLPNFAYTTRLLDSGKVLVNASIPTPRSAGYPLHVLSRSGVVLRSIGSETAELRPQCMACQIRIMAIGQDYSSVWMALPDQYILELWSLQGQLKRRVRIESTWFPEFTSDQRATMRAILSPITDIRMDQKGFIWVRANYPPESPGMRVESTGGVRRIHLPPPPGSVLDIIDPESGQLILTKRYEKLNLHFLEADLGYSTREDEDGLVAIDVWRISFRTK